MFNQMFGAFLVEEAFVSKERLGEILNRAMHERVRLGTIAVAEGLLTEDESDIINHLQAQHDMRFGDIAVKKGYLTQEQVDYLVSKQGNPFMQFIQILFEENCMTPEELEWKLSEFQESRGFTEDDMDALKSDDIDQIVNLFAFCSQTYISDMIGLFMRNVVRFVTDDFYIGHIEKVDEIITSNMVLQRTFGDHSLYLGVAADENDTDGFISMACDYTKDNNKVITDYTYDALCEFINTVSGLFATNLSHKGLILDMEPPVAFRNQIINGKAYIVPFYIHQKKVNIYVAMDTHLIYARNPLELNITKTKGSEVTAHSKGRIVIVDDSALARKVLRTQLEENGYTVVCEAVNGEEAVEVYKKYKPDLITLDITMPIMDGVDALQEICEQDPKANAIMITAAGQEKRVIQAIRLGAKEFIVKPFEPDALLKTIDSFFKE